MTLRAIPANLGYAGSKQNTDLKGLFTELQGLRFSIIDTGETATTKMNVAALRQEDTILSVMATVKASGVMSEDIANVTIQPTKAFGTLTVSAIADADVCVVNDVTYTFKNTPTAPTHVKRTAGNDNANAAALAAAINAYEAGYTGSAWRKPAVVATVLNAVVTVTSVVDGAGNGPVVTDTGSTITIDSTDPAAVTGTFVSADNTDAITVNGVIFTIRTTPADVDLDMAIVADDTLQAALAAKTINAYQDKYGTLDAVATSALGVVTITPYTPKAGNIIVLTGTAVRLVASGSGLLADGTATGGIKSSTDLHLSSVVVIWFNKDNA